MLRQDLLSETLKLDLLNKGDRARRELFLAFELRIGDRLVLMREELFYRFLVSFWDLKKMRAGVEVFFLEEEKGLSVG